MDKDLRILGVLGKKTKALDCNLQRRPRSSQGYSASTGGGENEKNREEENKKAEEEANGRVEV